MSSPRGGSTLTSFVVGQHSKVANLGEVCFIPKLLSLDEHCTCGAQLNQCNEWGKVFEKLRQTTGVDMRKTPYGLHLDDAMKWPGGTGKVDHQRQTKSRVAIAKYRSAWDTLSLKLPSAIGGGWASLPSAKQGAKNTMALFDAAANHWDADMVVDASKLPRKAVHLYREFPEHVRILHLTRDGRGVSASRMGSMGFAKATERWQHYHQVTKELINKWIAPEHVFSMQYEAFTSNPEQRTKELCQWLGLSYEPKMLEFNTTDIFHSAGGNPTRFKLAEEGIRPTDDRWRSKLSEEEIRQFEATAGPLNRALGYN
ncbi:sulfotransferase [Halioxenophilus aromaticivorans]|uniref:Sulfotransferase n=2 Tax=Halioxenophilus aromaticivorans TaxID=1306992 RepID=A0AAV3U1C4_9ALTE